MTENFPILMTDGKLQIQDTQTIPSIINKEGEEDKEIRRRKSKKKKKEGEVGEGGGERVRETLDQGISFSNYRKSNKKKKSLKHGVCVGTPYLQSNKDRNCI